jgi:hypothetical protein
MFIGIAKSDIRACKPCVDKGFVVGLMLFFVCKLS